jgi:hypothetical protein
LWRPWYCLKILKILCIQTGPKRKYFNEPSIFDNAYPVEVNDHIPRGSRIRWRWCYMTLVKKRKSSEKGSIVLNYTSKQRCFTRLTFMYRKMQNTKLPKTRAEYISPRWSYTIAGLKIPNLKQIIFIIVCWHNLW